MRHEIVFRDLGSGAVITDRVDHEILAQAVVTMYYVRYVVSFARVRDRNEVIDHVLIPVRRVEMEGVLRP